MSPAIRPRGPGAPMWRQTDGMHAAAAALLVFVVAAVGGTVRPAGAMPDDELADKQWGLTQISAEPAWAVGRGAGIVIAIVDTGVDLDHPDLAGKIVPGYDFVDDDDVAQDEHGHGTHVAGIAAAHTGNGIGIAGVAPDAKIMPVRVLDEEGSGSGADVAAGIRWAADQGAHVINLSLGENTQAVLGPSFDAAIEEAWSKGAICVVAAGNDFVLSSGFSDQPALVVSATDRNDAAPLYSNGVGSAQWGMAAPGGAGFGAAEDDILSTYLDDTYGYLAGTSMAAPHVAGAAAVLRSTGLSPREAVARLLATADDIGAEGRDSTFGSGRLNLAAAVGAPASTTTTTSLAPAAPAPPAQPTTTTTTAPGPGPGPTAGRGAGTPTKVRPVTGQVAPVTTILAPAESPTTDPGATTTTSEPGATPVTTDDDEVALEGVDVTKPIGRSTEDRKVPIAVAAVLAVVALAGAVLARRHLTASPSG